MIYIIDHINDFKKILKKDNPIIVNFYALWCDDCLKINKYIKNIYSNSEYNNLIFVNINIDKSIDIRDYSNINSVPTIQIYNNNKYVCEYIGSCNIQINYMLNYAVRLYSKKLLYNDKLNNNYESIKNNNVCSICVDMEHDN
jgi:thiol-disulfide isomerase/thioredoxin